MTIESIIEQIAAPEAPSFYRTHWGEERRFAHLPIMTFETVTQTPLADRLYTTEPYLTSVIERGGNRAVWAKTLPTIATDSYGTLGERPLVAALDISRNVELGLWCYAQKILPLSVERNAVVTIALAKRYGIDSILLDEEALPSLQRGLLAEIEPSTLRHVALTGYAFSKETRDFIAAYPRAISVTLSLPETGTIAELCKDSSKKQLIFHPQKHVLCEVGPTLVVTKKDLSLIPIVRYDTELPVEKVLSLCVCKKETFTLRLP